MGTPAAETGTVFFFPLVTFVGLDLQQNHGSEGLCISLTSQASTLQQMPAMGKGQGQGSQLSPGICEVK